MTGMTGHTRCRCHQMSCCARGESCVLPGKIKCCDGQGAEEEATATGGPTSESLGDSTGKVLEAGCESAG